MFLKKKPLSTRNNDISRFKLMCFSFPTYLSSWGNRIAMLYATDRHDSGVLGSYYT